MVTIASATLWITQQLAVWAIGVQALAIALSLWRRGSPFAWQRNPIALNLGMMAVTGTTIQVALQGGPATLGLAHFAALTQGLQLIDARPRRTEFLLVALALFQVVLASNLTDSVFFIPLLVGFLFATAWTLVVHTLRCEAAEADDHQSATEVLTPGLLRITLLSSAASVGLALVLFILLPRLHSSVMQASAFGPGFATAGFSDQVALGDIGKIRQDSTVVLRVETLEGKAPDRADAYWRGLAFDHFDGTTWSVTPKTKTPIPGSAEIGVQLGRGPSSATLVQRIFREPVAGGVLFEMGVAREIQGSIHRLERDRNGGLYAAGQTTDRLHYTVASERRAWSDAALRRDIARPPVPSAGGLGHRIDERYLQLPELSSAVAELAREIAQHGETDADRVRALEQYLLRTGRYSDTPPAIDAESDRSPVEAFLFEEMAAHCEYYASALVVLTRSLGLPARLVNGFAGGRENRIGGFIELSRSHAHAWAEVHYERAGWVRYDATPPNLRQRAETSLSLDERIHQLASAMEHWWFQRVIGFDRSDQLSTLKRVWLALRDTTSSRGQSAVARSGKPTPFRLDGDWRRAVLGPAALALAVVLLWRIRRRRSPMTVPRYYDQALRLLSRRGIVRAPATGARDFARSAGQQLGNPAARALSTLTECYLADRFGGRPPAQATANLQALRRALRPSRSRGISKAGAESGLTEQL
jgi:transglutaminase-like putative cysteine protease